MFRRTFLHGLLTTMVGATCSWKPPKAPVSVALTGEAMQRVFLARGPLFAPPSVVTPVITFPTIDPFSGKVVPAGVVNAGLSRYIRMKRLKERLEERLEEGFFRRILPPNPMPGE